MSHPKRFYLASIIGPIIVLAGSEAPAGFETFSATTPGTGGLSKTNLSLTLSIPAFNPLNGTLESIVVSSMDKAQISAGLTNNAASTAAFTVTDAVNYGISFKGTTIVSDTDNVKASRSYTLGSGGTASFGTYNLTGTSGPETIIDPAMLDQFKGTGNLNFIFNSNATVGTGGFGGNVFINPVTLAGSTLTVTYNFISPNVVPEPASVAMTALGGLLAGGVGVLRSRSRSRAPKVS